MSEGRTIHIGGRSTDRQASRPRPAKDGETGGIMAYKYGRNPFKPHNNTMWSGLPGLYKVTHEDGEFLLTASGRLDYRETIRLLKDQGYKKPFITYIGRNAAI